LQRADWKNLVKHGIEDASTFCMEKPLALERLSMLLRLSAACA
jgi:hypothetical protein